MLLKYIIVETTGKDPKRIPFVFPRLIDHDAMYEGVRTAFIAQDLTSCKISTAGFLNKDMTECSGYSETLRMGPGAADLELIRETYGLPSLP